MRRLCLFTGGFAAAAGLYLFLLHGAPGVLLAALAAVCALLFLLRRPILRRAAVCVLGLLAGFAWCRGYEALFLRPFADLSGETAAFSAQALAAPQESSYGQSVSARLTLDGKSCTAVIYFDEADGEILPGSLLSGTAKFTTAQEKHLRGKDYDLSRGVFLTAGCRETLHAEPGRTSVWLAPALFAEPSARRSSPHSRLTRRALYRRCCWAIKQGSATRIRTIWPSRAFTMPLPCPVCTFRFCSA